MTAKYNRDRVTDEAASWFVCAQTTEMCDSDRAALAEWFAASAEHVREYLACASLSVDLRNLTNCPDVDELILAARDPADATNIVALYDNADSLEHGRQLLSPQTLSHRLVWPGGVVVGLIWSALLIVLAIVLPTQYSTGIGEQLSFQLRDGSVVTLNACSKIQVDFSDKFRTVRLLDGEALFHVSKDTLRPFQVQTDHAVVRAVGTIFDVRNRNDVTTVTVLEGAIDVKTTVMSGTRTGNPQVEVRDPSISLARVVTGEQVKVLPKTNHIVAQPEANIENAIAWRERRITFSSRPLSAVVEEFNLYNESRIVITDAALAGRLVSGTFSVDDEESFVLFLSAAGIADYEERSDGRFLLQIPER